MREYRLATYNIKVTVEDAGPDAWKERVDAVAGTIRHHRPDLIGLQEPTAAQLDDLRDRLPAYDWVGVGRRDGDRAGEFSPVGFRRDRFDVDETRTFWLSETPDEVGSVGWDADLPRILTWARLRDRDADESVLHANTHFSHVGERARAESARLIRERLASVAEDEPVVFTGDLNCEPGSRPYEILTGDGPAPELIDTESRAEHGHHGPDHTFTGFTDPRSGERIDYVLTSTDLAVEHHATCADLRSDGRVPSDHLPVVADVVRS